MRCLFGQVKIVYIAMIVYRIQFHQMYAMNQVVGLSSIKLVLATWAIYGVIITSSYECNLRAYLMQIDHEKPIDNIKDIFDQRKFIYIYPGIDYASFFVNLPVEAFKYERMLMESAIENQHFVEYGANARLTTAFQKVRYSCHLRNYCIKSCYRSRLQKD